MGAEDSVRKLKRKKNSKKKGEEDSEIGSFQLAQTEENSYAASKEQKKKKIKKKGKKSSADIANKVDAKMLRVHNLEADEVHEISRGNKKSKKLKSNKRKNGKVTRTEIEESDTPHINEVEKNFGEKDVGSEPVEDKLQKSRKKKRRNVARVNKVDELDVNDDASGHQEEMATTESKPEDHIANSRGLIKADAQSIKKDGKSKKPGKTKKKSQLLANESSPDNLLEKKREDAEDEVYLMSSGDEDCSKGMKKWITEYHQSRPGIKLLQERIDDFIVAHEAKEEQARAEREAQAAEGGWTVVVHHKGRKKTTDAESGIAVGSVAQAAVLDKMAKKKKNDVGLDFYRFQKREAHRNEIMMLQSKFEQDKKRIQQMRAARKFRPY
ncbi:hypothetical protein CDL12_14594 [Handroanthus impetiginosus]|uniref:Ribosomal RNA-processing protein 7 C-terminal domain-containing protein n=1 Tax=Handroanthus impetiginosus TaxID=429701 RepID=A0A2G9H668_9LAMI|nr:hypothetical protein CDL12_14594 [Handroanthus impetiginosus]